MRLLHGDCLEVMPTLDADSVDAIVTDPPYGLGFMGKDWDHGVPGDAFWREALRVAKPGAHLLAFGGTRTFHRLACAIEDAGWEIRDTVMWVYGCLSEDTELLIDGRWEPYHKAIDKGHALCYDSEHEEYRWEPIQDFVEYDYDDTAFRIVSDRTDQIVSRNHRCLVERDGRFVFRYAETLERQEAVPVLEGLPELLCNLPLRHERTGGAESVLQPRLCAAESRQNEAAERAQGTGGCLCDVRQGSVEAKCVASEVQDGVLLSGVQRTNAREGMGETRTQGPCGMDERVGAELLFEDARAVKSGVEGRRDLLPQARELQACQVCSLPAGVHGDGPQRRVCDGASAIRGSGDRPPADAHRSCASQEPRPAGQPAGKSGTVRQQSGPQAVRASRHTVADLARVEPVHYTGKVWCIRVPTGAFVARRNGKVFVTGNSGFPKSHNLKGDWQGWGTALKPAFEPILLCRKPLTGTVAQNVQRYGAGALNIDGCRVESGEDRITQSGKTVDIERGKCANGYDRPNATMFRTGKPKERNGPAHTQGRWPSNLIHDGSEEVVGLFPVTKAGVAVRHNSGGNTFGGDHPKPPMDDLGYADSGSAARFYYCAKASKRDRDEGCEGMEERTKGARDGERVSNTLKGPTNSLRPDAATKSCNHHPTVKPTALMRYLCRLVTPPNGTVLDPFMGSGSTGKAATLEGFDFIGIEREAEYIEIARARIAHAATQTRQADLFEEAMA